MKKTLGKILIIILFAIQLSANIVNTSVSAPAIYKGESVSFTISASGDKIIFPKIDEIDTFKVLGTSSSQSTSIINGNVSRNISKTYAFSPKKSIIIPSYEVVVDGKTYKTKELKVSVLKPTVSKKGSDFIVQMSVDKKIAYVGESIKLTILFKQKLNANADKLQLGEPKLEDFWIKKVDNIEKSNEGEYIVQKINYILFPQKSGKYTLPAIEANIGKVVRSRGSAFNDPFFDDPFFNSFVSQLKWQKIFTNDIDLDIKPLPNNLELFGNFEIEASVDKKEVNANKPVNLTIKVKGKGNIEDIKKFDIDIDNAIIYADEPSISSKLVDETYYGEFTQKIAIISDQNFTITPIKLEYFNKDSNKTETIQTKPIDITVKGGVKKSIKKPIEVAKNIDIQKPNTTIKIKEKSDYSKYLFFLAGLIIGAGVMYMVSAFKTKKTQTETEIIKEIKRAKTDRALFDLLLPYSQKDKFIKKSLEKLEENIYKNSNHKIDKDRLIELFEEFNMSDI